MPAFMETCLPVISLSIVNSLDSVGLLPTCPQGCLGFPLDIIGEINK